MTPAEAGGRSAPGSSFHIGPVDYGGDLHLLVGASSAWLTGLITELTAAALRLGLAPA